MGLKILIHSIVPSAEGFHPLKAKWRELSLNKTAGQGSVRLSAVKIALKATGQAGLNTIKPSESWLHQHECVKYSTWQRRFTGCRKCITALRNLCRKSCVCRTQSNLNEQLQSSLIIRQEEWELRTSRTTSVAKWTYLKQTTARHTHVKGALSICNKENVCSSRLPLFD